MSNKNNNSGVKRWPRVVMIILCTILLLLLLLMLGLTAYVNRLLGQMNRVEGTESVLSSSEAEQLMYTDPELETVDPTSTETIPHIDDVTIATSASSGLLEEQGSHIVNILLIGQDRREGEGRARSDSMILVTFNKSQNTITLTSFMRDMYVLIPGYLPNKMNAAYQYGGMSLLNQTLEVNFGVRVDGDVEVDFSEFKEIIDYLGGVDISLTQKEADYLNTNNGWSLSSGVQHLDGEKALAYSRIRYIDSDYRRAERQRKVLIALINKYKSLSATEMVSLLDEILPLVTTNMSNSEIVSYVLSLASMLSGSEINTLRIPADGTFDSGNVLVREGLKNWFQYNIDFEPNKDLLRQVFAK